MSTFAWWSADALPEEGAELGWGRRQLGTLSGVTWGGRVLLDVAFARARAKQNEPKGKEEGLAQRITEKHLSSRKKVS